MMYLIIILIIVIVVVGFLSTLRKRDFNIKKEEYFPYKAKWTFMTPAELSFYKQLEVAVGDKYYIIPQVQLSKILWSLKEYRYQNKIDKKTIDFVLFSKPDFKFVKAIELNDFTHDRRDRKERDEFVGKVMKAAGLELQIVDDRESFKPF